MEITVRRTGGFAGIARTAQVRTDDLDPPAADELRALVREADLPAVRSEPSGADRFQYEIHVRDGDREQRAIVHDGAMPEPVRRLVDRVQELSAATP
jgi:hypothetical protein